VVGGALSSISCKLESGAVGGTEKWGAGSARLETGTLFYFYLR